MATKTKTTTATKTSAPVAAGTKPVSTTHKAPPKQNELTGRPVLFNALTVCGIEIPEEDLLVSASDMKTILGWESESEHEARLTDGVSPEVASKMNVKYGSEYDLIDYNGEKVRLRNNTRNRPLSMQWAETVAQEVLNERWEFNGEAGIVGETGLCLSLQHRGVGVILAEQIRSYEGDDEEKLAKAAHWQKRHPDEIAVKMLVVRGIKETPNVTRTLDNVRPRSLSDVLFADTSLFAQTAKADREKLCRITDYAIRTVWHRTGCSDDAFSPKRTHSESLEFLTRHPRLLKAVMHIYTETNKKNDKGEKVSVLANYISAGTAAGLMFLMGASTSDRERWDGAESPNDRHLSFDRWDEAEAFWAGLGDASNSDFEPIRKAIAKCGNKDTGAKPPVPVVIAVIVNGWNEYVDPNGELSVPRVMPEFGAMDDYGNRPLVSQPSVGGIDLGDPKQVKKEREEAEAEAAAAAAAEEAETAAEETEEEDEDSVEEVTEGPSEEEQAEIAARAAEEKRKSLAAKTGTPAKKGGLRGGTSK